MSTKGRDVDTAVLVAVVALVSALVTKLADWWRGRDQDTADVAHTYVESSTDIVTNFRTLLDERTKHYDRELAEIRRSRDEDRDEYRTELDRLRGRMERLETRLAAERQERAAAEALAAELDSELHAANQHIDVLVSLLAHHGIDPPPRPTPKEGTS